MAKGVITEWDRLVDFERREIAIGEKVRAVFVAGSGPGVILVHEVPGITPEVARFARWVRDAGFRVYLPSLLGEPGKPNSPAYAMQSALRACISREFALFGANKSSPIVDGLRALARQVHAECGGRGVGALGMCLTGNFAITMMLEPAVLAPVLCQPSLPVTDKAGAGASPGELAAVRARLEDEDLTMRAYRFAGDPMCAAARFETLAKALGPRFIGETLPDNAAKPNTILAHPHSVVTTHLIDEAGSLTRGKVDEITSFFRARLC